MTMGIIIIYIEVEVKVQSTRIGYFKQNMIFFDTHLY